MDPKRILVLYYSRTGTTQTLARAIRDELGCEIERITEHRSRRGVLGYLRSAFDATFRRPAVLRPMDHDAEDFDLVVVGTPIWNASVSSPVRTYLSANRDHIRRIAFFCTYDGRGNAHALRQMEAIAGQVPAVTLALRSGEVARGAPAKVRSFANALRSAPPKNVQQGLAAGQPVLVPA